MLTQSASDTSTNQYGDVFNINYDVNMQSCTNWNGRGIYGEHPLICILCVEFNAIDALLEIVSPFLRVNSF